MSEYKSYKPFNKGLFVETISGPFNHTRAVTEKQRIEADAVGLDVLCSSTDPNKNLYKYRQCGHMEYLQPTHVRRNHFRCDTCQHSKEVAEANTAGITLLFKTKGNYRLYLKTCGHVFESTVQNIQGHKGNCQQCFEESMIAAASTNGYDVVGYDTCGKRIIRFKACGHEKVAHQTQLFKGNVVCRECLLSEHITAANEQGLVFISQTTDRYNIYKLPCGHEKELRQDHAQDGTWLCSHCGDSHYNKPSNVYIVKFTYGDFSWLKFGFAKHVSVRTQNYGIPSGTIKQVLSVVPFESGHDAMLFEKAVHAKYKKLRYPKDKMIKYHTFNGFTECYPVEALDMLLKELTTIKERECQK